MSTNPTPDTRPHVNPRTDPTGVCIDDPIDGVALEMYTPHPVDPDPVSTEQFHFPVDTAATMSVSRVEVPRLSDVYVRTADGNLVGEASNRRDDTYPRAAYNVELTGRQVKLYLAVESEVTVRSEGGSTVVEVADPPVTVGVRSLHEQPAGTVTTSESVSDLMRAVSHLGSALKTTSPERSFPTLRGHPPLIETGDRLSVPRGIDVPDTGVRIEVPPRYESVFTVSSLAYYLGAEVVPGRTPRIVAGDAEHELTAPDGFEAEVERVLKRTFFLDCVARTEGYYRVDLHERRQVEPHLDVDLAALYDAPLAERVAAHLDVPHEVVEPHLPAWKLTTDVVPEPEHAEVLPFTARDLAVVRCPSRPNTTTLKPEPEALTDFYRDARVPVRGSEGELDVVKPGAADSLERAWVGDGLPLGASKLTPESCRRRLDRATPEEGPISVSVVCNDPLMDDETETAGAFGPRDFVEFDVSVATGVPTDELRELFAEPVDFLHYVGHVDDRGVECPDGYLDAATLSTVNVDSFLLNACQSYRQGQHLVETGALAGIVTLSNVGNGEALEMGRTLTRLLDYGFPLSAALNIAREENYAGDRYIVVGDGNVSLTHAVNGMPYVADVEQVGAETFRTSIYKHPSDKYGIGTMTTPYVKGNEERFLSGGELGPMELSEDELRDFLGVIHCPIRYQGELFLEENPAILRD